MTLPADQIERVEVPKPPTMDAAIASIRGGNAAAAIVPLEKILREYHMLQWDIEAARWLAQVYLNMNKADRAIMLCERVIKSNPAAAYSGDLSGIYWQALIKADRDAKLGSILDKAVQQGSRELAARALIARGDILRKNRKLKEALVDGYLRTVILFEQVKSAQPEALAKAASCFEAQGDTANAERMRKKLLASYPDSPFARQMK
jgi:TolA-binding protein